MSWLKRWLGGTTMAKATQREKRKSDPAALAVKHEALTQVRLAAYTELFGANPSRVFSHTELAGTTEPDFLIDVLVFTLATDRGEVDIAVTNGMSDQRMVEKNEPSTWARRELIQYLRRCSLDHAGRLHDMAWLPLYDEFVLNFKDTIDWPRAAVEGTPWSAAFFLYPHFRTHDEFRMTVEADPVNLLWHIPISPQERKFALANGTNALIERLDAVKLPWIFDESNRPSLLD